ncbi:MAG: Lrp/AsnC ligand binding domain-containing protein [Chloroflexi bacterium]|nr:Lrp/AsnC ligand binding domain-containing protein [Chloroflexota bacterium]MBU1748754.1 Lrp/AsnC ligand binding domain-containing protein [Chloroflexota bacterium]MBU1879864.1 Lrp/AsnC ligand binding domain-containing protein [Chloroflexota bacterium]
MKRIEDREDTVAFLLIKTELGAASEVAAEASRHNWTEESQDGTLQVKGVRWANVVTGPYDVLAAVRVKDNAALGKLVVNRIQVIPGIANPLTLIVTEHYKNGEPTRSGDNGYP